MGICSSDKELAAQQRKFARMKFSNVFFLLTRVILDPLPKGREEKKYSRVIDSRDDNKRGGNMDRDAKQMPRVIASGTLSLLERAQADQRGIAYRPTRNCEITARNPETIFKRAFRNITSPL